jgi:hypothetical protein
MSKTDCIVCSENGILTNGSNLNISLAESEDLFICFDCFQKRIEFDEDGGGLRIFERRSVCHLCFNDSAHVCIPCGIKMYHSRLNGFLMISKAKPL